MKKVPIGVAVDLGSTTVGVRCMDWESGTENVSFSFSNPQKRYGADIISRIRYCMEHGTQKLSDCVREELERQLRERLGTVQVRCVVYSGNTTMLHILRNLCVDGLAASPFSPVTLDYEKEMETVYLPGFSAFVGADILAGAQALSMGQDCAYDLLIDLGTNGELLLLNRNQGYASSTACGPVFDYGVTGAVYGSDCIHAIAACVKRGLIDSTGLIREPLFQTGIQLDRNVFIRQDQVRRFQMAKAAIYAGILCLFKKAGVDVSDVRKVYVSGGLGFYMDVRDAFTVKMLPDKLRGKVNVTENTSLHGAWNMLCAVRMEEEAQILSQYEAIRSRTESFQLAEYALFNELYIDSMDF